MIVNARNLLNMLRFSETIDIEGLRGYFIVMTVMES